MAFPPNDANAFIRAGLIPMGLLLIWAVAFHPLPVCAQQDDKIVIAHRGASGYLPEHTLAAYAMAYGQGADFIEPDVVLTRDGVPLLLHDRTLNATTNVAERFPDRARDDGKHYAIDFTLQEIGQLSVRERDPGRFPSDHEALTFRVPTLAELIELVQGLNTSTGRSVGILLEVKSADWHRAQGRNLEAAVLQVLEHHELAPERVVIQSFEASALRRMHAMDSPYPQSQLVSGGNSGDPMVTEDGLDEIATYADGVNPAISRILNDDGSPVDDYALIQRAHARGLTVHPWTLRADDLPAYAESYETLLHRLLYETGADGIITDHPDRAVEHLEHLDGRP